MEHIRFPVPAPSPSAWAEVALWLKRRRPDLSYRGLADLVGMPHATVANAMMGFCRPTQGLTETLAAVFGLNPEELAAWKRLDHAARLAWNVRVRDGATAQRALTSPLLKRAEQACKEIEGHLANLALALETLQEAKKPPAETFRFAREAVTACEEQAVTVRQALARLRRPVVV